METTCSPTEALALAVRRAGSQVALAKILGTRQSTIYTWLNSSGRLPAEMVLRVEAATGVSRHDLRPDIYPRDLPPFQERAA